MHTRPAQSAFSLVELSIVLVILGLLTGGILAGQSLIRAAELRAVSTEYQRYMTAAATFRDKYFALPGDFRDATRFWGFAGTTAAPGCVSQSGITTVTNPGTCDGNGNGNIGGGAAGGTGEAFQMWRHMALAGLIEGDYTGLHGATVADEHDRGINCPAAKMSNGLWGMWWTTDIFAGSGYDYAINGAGNTFLFGGEMAAYHPNTSILRPEEAWNIDTKMDDGKPATGRVIGRNWNNACAAADSGTTANDNFNASYRLSDTSLRCTLRFRMGV